MSLVSLLFKDCAGVTRFAYKRFLLVISIFCLSVFASGSANAQCCGCASWDCGAAVAMINYLHDTVITDHTNDEFDDDLSAFEDWVIDEFLAKEIIPAMQMFTTQMNAIAMQQVEIFGAFLDAKQQLETQRLFQQLEAEAYKDYTPSDDFCWFGTNVRSMSASVVKSRANTYVLGRKALNRQLGNANNRAAPGTSSDLLARWEFFKTTYCDPSDNNRSPLVVWDVGSVTGLMLACGKGAVDKIRTNKDIDYTRNIELPRSVFFDYSDGSGASSDEQDIYALSENLYGHRVLSRELTSPRLNNPAAQNIYFALRSVAAKRSVAQYTFNAIVGLKASGTVSQYEDYVNSRLVGFSVAGLGHTRQYLAAILSDLYPYDRDIFSCITKTDGKKLCDWDMYKLAGEDPSYFAQLEIMGKRMYQNPDFYVKLYDTPANVARKGVAMQAIELMIDREMYESQLRREMVVSVLLSSKLRDTQRRVNEKLIKTEAIVGN